MIRCKLLSILMLLTGLLLSGCASSARDQGLEPALRGYGQLIRYSQYEAALRHHHPDWLRENPVSALQINRLALFRVTGYNVVDKQLLEDGNTVAQKVALSLYNIQSPKERTLTYEQIWRYDAEYERWMLHSGLPDVTQR